MQSHVKIQRKLLFVIILQISVFIIVALLSYNVDAQTLHNQTLEEKIKKLEEGKDNPQIGVGNSPIDIEFTNNDRYEYFLYVANAKSDTVSVISTDIENITQIAKIPVGKSPIAMVEESDNLYVANYDSGTVSVISTENNTKIADIPVGGGSVTTTAAIPIIDVLSIDILDRTIIFCLKFIFVR